MKSRQRHRDNLLEFSIVGFSGFAEWDGDREKEEIRERRWGHGERI